MASLNEGHRHIISQLAFVFLVVLIPIGVGFMWMEHQRTDDLVKVNEARRQALVDSCVRGNTVRRQFRDLVEADKEQARLLIDYMNLDIASKQPAPTIAEHQALHRLTLLYAQANRVPILPIVDCERTIK